MMRGPMILRTEGLTKIFDVGLVRRRRVQAVEDLTLTVEEGEIFGFVGPNGAGKTTTIKMLMGLIHPTRGQGLHLRRADPVPERPRRASATSPSTRPGTSSSPAARRSGSSRKLADVPRAERRAALRPSCSSWSGSPTRPTGRSGSTPRACSSGSGSRRRWSADPAFVVLDEPMSGLDPIGRKEMRDLILELKRRGKTVFFSTHILPDVETLCDRVGVILDGRLRDVGRLGDLLSAADP